jgi:hypothetical protein
LWSGVKASKPDWLAEKKINILVQSLRAAFQATLTDPEFLEDARKMTFEVNSVSGRAVKALIDEPYSTPDDVVAKVRRVISTQYSMIPKSCRPFGQDHATEQMLRAKSRFNLKRFRSSGGDAARRRQFSGRETASQGDSQILVFAVLEASLRIHIVVQASGMPKGRGLVTGGPGDDKPDDDKTALQD